MSCGSTWQAVREQTVFTAGPLHLSRAPSALDPAAETVTTGYGQLNEPLRADGELVLAAAAEELHWDGGEGDAGRIWIDETDCGWMWGPDWHLSAPAGTTWARGHHTVRIDWIASTYNVYGPHHYYAGDRFVISPDQFTGKRNFADPADAPLHTHVAGWHFRTVRLPTLVRAGRKIIS